MTNGDFSEYWVGKLLWLVSGDCGYFIFGDTHSKDKRSEKKFLRKAAMGTPYIRILSGGLILDLGTNKLIKGPFTVKLTHGLRLES